MNVSCPQCSTTYRVDPAKVPPGGVRARCSACGGVIQVGMGASPVHHREPTPPRGATLPPLRPTPHTPWPSVPTPSAPQSPTAAPGFGAPPPVRPFFPSQTPVSVPAVTPPPPSPVIPRPPVQGGSGGLSSRASDGRRGHASAGHDIISAGTRRASSHQSFPVPRPKHAR